VIAKMISKNNGNVLNVNKLMHEYSKLNVSPKAVKELSGRINDKLYDIAPELDKIARSHGRKTVMEEDVIELLSFVDKDVL
jgi:histone H3/H4